MKNLKNIIKSTTILGVACLLTFISACKKDTVIGDLGQLTPTADQVVFTMTPSAANPNIVQFTSQSKDVIKVAWDLGNGTSVIEGENATGSYPLAGTYTVTLKIVTPGGGTVQASKTLVIAATNFSMLSDPEYGLLSGGLNAGGKTWMVDSMEPGHLGVGPITSGGPDWYQAGPNEKASNGFYDDEMTFTMTNTGLTYTYDNKGGTFTNASNSRDLGGTGSGDDPTLPYTPPANMAWSLSQSGGKTFININNGGFIAYYLGVSSYEILSISEDFMHLRMLDNSNAGNAWYLKLIRKGHTRPVVPPVEKPLAAANLNDDFDGGGNVEWLAENINFKVYDNPLPLTPNTSSKVGFYEKLDGNDFQYGNLQMTSASRFDLSTKNKIRLKVYIPSANDYTKVASQVAVKLQNSLMGGNAWQTQKESIKVIAAGDYNKWIILEFDFSQFASEKVYDKIVIQLGGEGHPNPGIFYIDDFEFK